MRTECASFARTLRRKRLYHHSGRLLVVPLDHAVSDGPIVPDGDLDGLVARIVEHDVDAVVLHKGCLRRVRPERFRSTSLIVHLSASTAQAPDPDAKVLVAGVEEAVRCGADAVSVHVNVGSRDETRQLRDLGTVAGECDRWNVPLLAMMYPRGPRIADPRDPYLIAHAVAIAADLGADLVKTVYPGSIAGMAAVTRGASVPVLVAGGPTEGGDIFATVQQALDGGAAGVAVGRHVIHADDVGATTRKLAELVHGNYIEVPR